MDKQNHDFGIVSPSGAIVDLAIQNKGTQDLVIKEVARTGACKVIEWPKQLAPGERRFDIGNFDSYFRAFVEFALADPRHGAELHVLLVLVSPFAALLWVDRLDDHRGARLLRTASSAGVRDLARLRLLRRRALDAIEAARAETRPAL